jgi:hypothetical protein
VCDYRKRQFDLNFLDFKVLSILCSCSYCVSFPRKSGYYIAANGSGSHTTSQLNPNSPTLLAMIKIWTNMQRYDVKPNSDVTCIAWQLNSTLGWFGLAPHVTLLSFARIAEAKGTSLAISRTKSALIQVRGTCRSLLNHKLY